MTEPTKRILLVSPRLSDSRLLNETLASAPGAHFQLISARTLSEALPLASQEPFDLVLLDLALPDSKGLGTYLQFKKSAPDLHVVVLVPPGEEELGAAAVAEGAKRFLPESSLGRLDLDALTKNTSPRDIAAATPARSAASPVPAGLPNAVDGGRRLRQLARGWSTRKLTARAPADSQQGDRPAGRVLGFIGAKGGVGTTTVALDVAAQLIERRRDVIAAELRPYHGTFATMLCEVPVSTLGTLLKLDVSALTAPELSCCLEKVATGLRVLFAPQRPEDYRDFSADQSRLICGMLATMTQFLVLDLPGDAAPATQVALRLCDSICVVVEPEPIAIRAGKWMIQSLHAWQIHPDRLSALVVNRGSHAVQLDEIQA